MPTTALMEKPYVSRHPVHYPDVRLHSYRLATGTTGTTGEVDGSNSESIAAIQSHLGAFSRTGLDQIIGEHRGFVNVSKKAIVEGACEKLPRDRIILEVLSDIITDPSVAARLCDLKEQGFTIAVENPSDRALRPGEADWADIVRVNAADLGEEELAQRVGALSKLSVQLLASQVDTHERFELCNRNNFDLYQGYFFCTPQLKNADIPANRLSALRILTKVRQPDITIEELEDTISNDVTLSYKLLRYANSAYIGLNRTVDSIKHATRMVGMDRIQLWASLLAFSKMEDRPRELMITALVRAAMCERLASSAEEGPREQFFTIGLLSVLDALMDRPMSEAVEQLPLSKELCNGLIHWEGAMGDALRSVIAYERNEWHRANFRSVGSATIRSHYLDSLGWARRITESLMI
jgi:EAL and modified HD-GYP domain-containing signal transduction protein